MTGQVKGKKACILLSISSDLPPGPGIKPHTGHCSLRAKGMCVQRKCVYVYDLILVHANVLCICVMSKYDL